MKITHEWKNFSRRAELKDLLDTRRHFCFDVAVAQLHKCVTVSSSCQFH